MYHQNNPTETFRERQLALLEEADNRRLAPKVRSARGGAAVALGFLVALLLASFLVVASAAGPAQTAFPEANGKIVFLSTRDGNNEIMTGPLSP